MAARQLSDANPDGTIIGQSTTDLIGFHGTAGTAQRSGAAQAAVSRNNAGGVIATFGSLQSPSAVAQGTTAEQSFTIQTGTGAQMLIASGDVLIVNKPTSQAGLGVGNVRVASSNTLGITFSNIPAAGGNITPTASQSYSLVAIRGMGNLSATLSPVAVAANTTVEQQFAVTGLPAGQLVQVMKPTVQAGLDIVGCRIVSNNLLGITFMNDTASPITPTASEVYTVLPLGGLDAIGNDVMCQMNVGTVGAIGVGVVVTGGSTAFTGALATDVVCGIQKPTNGAAATNAAFVIGAVPTANALTLYFGGIGTGATPTASEAYGIATKRLNPAAPLKMYSTSIAAASVAAATTAEQTFTVTGLVSGTPVWVNKPSWQAGLGIAGVRVSATDTLAITFVNATATAIVPTTETYTIGNFQVPSPGSGNCVYQAASPMLHAHLNLTNEIRAAAVAKGLIAGS